MAASESKGPCAGMVVVRVALGLTLFLHALGAIRSGMPDGFALGNQVRARLDDVPSVAAFWGESVLLENPDAVAFLWRWAVLILGAALLAGALTRPVGWLTTLLLLHGWLYGPELTGPACLFAAACAAGCALSRAGHRLGLDPLLEQMLPSWLTWRGPRKSFLD